ncbi:unnamed protein product, partial [Strongylus vulgaris]
MGVTRRFDLLRPINVQDDPDAILGRFNYAEYYDITSSNSSFDFSESEDELPDNVQQRHDSANSPTSRSKKNKERRAERNFDFSESEDELPDNVQQRHDSANSPTSRSKKNKERRAERKMRRFLDVENSGVNVKSSMGARRQRRLENFRILMNFADKDDICTDFSDLVPHTVTAFEKLFLDDKNMQVWNDFVERDEEEQRRILEEGEMKKGDTWFVVGGKPGPSSKL